MTHFFQKNMQHKWEISSEYILISYLYSQVLYSHFSCVVGRIIDEIVNPMRRLNMDLIEYVALKAILFFNPVVREINDQSPVENARYAFLRSLQRRFIWQY